MPIFACRWPNGDLTIVAAKDKDDAVCRLDELDNAETAHVFRVDNLLVDLTLADDGSLRMDDDHRFGEVCEAEIMVEAYPILEAALGNLGASANDPNAATVIAEAVQQERNRMGSAPDSVPIDPKLRALAFPRFGRRSDYAG